jgi:hypothetical protein
MPRPTAVAAISVSPTEDLVVDEQLDALMRRYSVERLGDTHEPAEELAATGSG